MIQVLLAESNYEERESLKQILSSWDDINLIDSVEDGKAAIEKAAKHNPDIVICGFALRNADGLTLSEQLKCKCDAKVIMMASAFSDMAIKRMMMSGVDHYMVRPFSPECLHKQIQFFAHESNKAQKQEYIAESTKAAATLSNYIPGTRQNTAAQDTEKSLDLKISNLFLTIGVPAHIKGYVYARDAVKMFISELGQLGSITKAVYPKIASTHNSTASKVERAIRHAIEVAWGRNRLERINDIFGVRVFDQKDRPTNSEFIALIADKLILESA